MKLTVEQIENHTAEVHAGIMHSGEDIPAVTARLKELDKQLETTYARWQILEELQT